MVQDCTLLIYVVDHQVTDILVLYFDHVIETFYRGDRSIKDITPVLPGRREENAQPFALPLHGYDRELQHVLTGGEDLRPVDQHLCLCRNTHTEDRGCKDNDICFDDLVMDTIHAVPLHALVEFLAGITTFAGIDVCLGQGDLFNKNIRILCHGCKHPVKQRLRIPVPPRAAGKREDLDWHDRDLCYAS